MLIVLRRMIAPAAALWTAALLVMPVRAAAAVPPADEIIRRVLTANAHAPKVASAAVLFKFRLNRPRGEPPNCEFEGTLRLEGNRQVVSIGRKTFGLTCWVVNRFAIGRFFEGREPVESFLSRFEFMVLGQKLVDGRPFYLVQGGALDSKTRPHGLVGWVDYDRGLVTEGTVEYDWGTLDTEQSYTQTEGAWVLTNQYLVAPRFNASMEILYSNFRFAPR